MVRGLWIITTGKNGMLHVLQCHCLCSLLGGADLTELLCDILTGTCQSTNINTNKINGKGVTCYPRWVL